MGHPPSDGTWIGRMRFDNSIPNWWTFISINTRQSRVLLNERELTDIQQKTSNFIIKGRSSTRQRFFSLAGFSWEFFILSLFICKAIYFSLFASNLISLVTTNKFWGLIKFLVISYICMWTFWIKGILLRMIILLLKFHLWLKALMLRKKIHLAVFPVKGLLLDFFILSIHMPKTPLNMGAHEI